MVTQTLFFFHEKKPLNALAPFSRQATEINNFLQRVIKQNEKKPPVSIVEHAYLSILVENGCLAVQWNLGSGQVQIRGDESCSREILNLKKETSPLITLSKKRQ